MRNPIRNYIDKRIKKVLREKELELEKVKENLLKFQKEKEKKDRITRMATEYRNRSITTGGCEIYDHDYRMGIKYRDREATAVKDQLRELIMKDIMTKLFIEPTYDGMNDRMNDRIRFVISKGLSEDLRKLNGYNI